MTGREVGDWAGTAWGWVDRQLEPPLAFLLTKGRCGRQRNPVTMTDVLPSWQQICGVFPNTTAPTLCHQICVRQFNAISTLPRVNVRFHRLSTSTSSDASHKGAWVARMTEHSGRHLLIYYYWFRLQPRNGQMEGMHREKYGGRGWGYPGASISSPPRPSSQHLNVFTNLEAL